VYNVKNSIEALKRKKRRVFLRNLTTYVRIMGSRARMKAYREVQLSRKDMEKGSYEYISEPTCRNIFMF
jgi:hypothetical protein